MANMTFGVNLIPNNGTNNANQKTLGNSGNKWDLYVNNINGQPYTGSSSSAALIITTTNTNASDALTASAQTLTDGQLVFVFLNKAMSGSTNATLQFGTASAINIYIDTSTQLQAAYKVGSLLGLLYTDGKLYMINPPVAV